MQRKRRKTGERLASASEAAVVDSFDDSTAVCIVTADAKIFIPMGDLIDFEAERKRLGKELAEAQKSLDFINNKLSNENFVSRAPAAVVDAQRAQAAKLAEKIAMLEESIAKLG